jgi:hypothetical protein
LKQHKNKSVRAAVIILGALLLSSCAAKEARPEVELPTAIEQKTASSPGAEGTNAIARRAAEDFIGMKGITSDQRAKLINIYLDTYDQALKIQKDISASKFKLFDLISSTSYSSASVDRLKQKIVDLDQKRLIIMFKALADVQAVVGYGKDKEPIYKHFYDYEHPQNEKQSKND